MKILVTGAAGFIGFHLTKRLVSEGHQVIGLDNFNNYYNPSLKESRCVELGFSGRITSHGVTYSSKSKNCGLIRLHLENYEGLQRLFSEHNFDMVCHLAAQAGVRYSLDNPRVYINSNLIGFYNILECCRNSKIKHLVFASSSSVYGLNEAVPFSTNDNVDHPISLYAATKKSNELLAHSYSHLFRIPTTGLRFFTVYGPWGATRHGLFAFCQRNIK